MHQAEQAEDHLLDEKKQRTKPARVVERCNMIHKTTSSHSIDSIGGSFITGPLMACWLVKPGVPFRHFCVKGSPLSFGSTELCHPNPFLSERPSAYELDSGGIVSN